MDAALQVCVFKYIRVNDPAVSGFICLYRIASFQSPGQFFFSFCKNGGLIRVGYHVQKDTQISFFIGKSYRYFVAISINSFIISTFRIFLIHVSC